MRDLMTEELVSVSGGWDCCVCPPPEPVKGNNGWGNGPDSTNAGSFSGGTEETKDNNTRDAGEVSPGPDKFTTR